MVKIKASEEGIQKINECREHKGWTKDQNSKALMITSQQEFKRALEEISLRKSADDTPLSIKQLKSLAKNIFTPESTITLRDEIDKLEKKNLTSITISQVLEKIELKELHAKRITYRNWQNFLQGKEIDKDVFLAFCKALEIENWLDVAETPKIYNQADTKPTRLVEGLSLFNHKKQINLLLERLCNKTGVFLVANQCQYSRTWMLRRLEAKISETIRLSCKPIPLKSTSYSSWGIREIKAYFDQKYSLTEIMRILQQEHMVLVLDIDSYDLKTLEDLIVQFWQPLVNQVTQTTPGHLLMFLLASNQGNDWQGKWQTSPTLYGQVTELVPANIFSVEDVADVIREIAPRLRQQLVETPEAIANRLINNSQGRTERLLQEIYHYFECRTTEFSLWQRYP